MREVYTITVSTNEMGLVKVTGTNIEAEEVSEVVLDFTHDDDSDNIDREVARVVADVYARIAMPDGPLDVVTDRG